MEKGTEKPAYRPYTPRDFVQTWQEAYVRRVMVQRRDGMVAVYVLNLSRN